MSRLSPLLWRRPVFVRHMRRLVTSRAAARALVAHLVALAAVTIAIAAQHRGDPVPGTGRLGIETLAVAGQSIFEYVLFFCLALILIVVPAFIGPAIAIERDQGTFAALRMTPLRARSIACDVVLAGVVYVGLLVVASMPFVVVAMLVGGVDLGYVVSGLAVVWLSGSAVVAMSVGVSASAPTAYEAVVRCYVLVALLTGATLVAFTLIDIDPSPGTTVEDHAASWLLAANPLTPIAAHAAEEQPILSATGQFGPFGPFGPGGPFVEPDGPSGSPVRGLRNLMHLDPALGTGFGPDGPFGPGVAFDRFGRPIAPEPVEEAEGHRSRRLLGRSALALGSLSVFGIALATWQVSRAGDLRTFSADLTPPSGA